MFMGSTWDPHGADKTQVGPMWATWTMLSGFVYKVLVGVTGYHLLFYSPLFCHDAMLTLFIYFDPLLFAT